MPAGLVVLADQGGTGPHRVLGQMVEADLGPGLEIGEQRHQLVMEQRQPVLHAREAAAHRHRLQERVVGHRPELLQEPTAEALGRRRVEHDLAHRPELQLLHLALRALAQGIEAADGLDRGAEEVEPHGLGAAAGEDVDQAAAHGILAGLDHGTGPAIAVAVEIGEQRIAVAAPAGRHPQRRPPDHDRCRHLLQDGIGRGEHEARLLRRPLRQPGQGGQPLRHQAQIGRDPVVGQAVPGRDADDLHRRREEAHDPGDERHPRLIAGDVQDGPCLAAAQPLGQEAPFQPFQRVGEQRGPGPAGRALGFGRLGLGRDRLEHHRISRGPGSLAASRARRCRAGPARAGGR